jgi:formate hydrogenlyase subunit 6/NADH:ubiquinone oxidoreductase subunit I
LVVTEENMAEDRDMVTIYVMGKQYKVPSSLTIQKAMEYAGYKLLRGCGCRGGFCGACATVFRTADDYRIKVGLACQTMVQDGMYMTQIPFYPATKAQYNIDELKAGIESIATYYPELFKCVQCNSCTKICPQDLQVMDYIGAAMRGDIAKIADLSFDCIMCGLCASRCPAEMVQYNIAMLARRLYAKHMLPRASHLEERLKELEARKFDEEIDTLMTASKDTLQTMYAGREIEAEEEVAEED